MQKSIMKQRNTSWLACILCAVLIAAMALSTIGCSLVGTSTSATDGKSTEAATATATVKGEGATVFLFTVTFADKTEKVYEIHTDKSTVGEALQELGLIAGEEGQFGLYVKTVDGVTVDYDKDKAYWAFYENGQMAPAGVDSTQIKPGASYAFKVES